MRELNAFEVEAVAGGFWVPPPKGTNGTGDEPEPWPGDPLPGGTYP